jgi:hypothetical protein
VDTVLARHAVYHPMIRFRDEGWLKTTALYWDTIGRIVPYAPSGSYVLGDTDVVARLRDEGIVREIPATQPALQMVRNQFVRVLSDEKAAAALRKHYGLARREEWGENAVSQTSVSYRGPDRDDSLGYLLASRVAYDLQEALVHEGFAKWMGANGAREWLGLHPALADLIMRSLAVAIATETGGLHPLTDRPADHAALPLFPACRPLRS